jgi:hypothetical protein
VKEKVLEKWIEEHAKLKAIEAAQAFQDGVVTEGRKTVPAERFAAIDEERDQNLKRIADDKELDDEPRKARVAAEHESWSDLVQSVVGPTVSTSFASAARGADCHEDRPGAASGTRRTPRPLHRRGKFLWRRARRRLAQSRSATAGHAERRPRRRRRQGVIRCARRARPRRRR